MGAAFFNTIDELKDYFPAWDSFNFRDIEPVIELAEQRYILPILGKQEFLNLKTAYDANNSNPASPYKDLLHMVRGPLAEFSFKMHVPRGNVNITSTGLMQEHQETSKPAFQWAIKDLKESLADSAFDRLDLLYDFLKTNSTDYQDWVSTGNFTERKAYFIQSAEAFTKVCSVVRNSHLNYLNLLGIMQLVEDFNIVSTIGQDMVDTLKQELNSGNVSSDNKKLLNLINPAVAWLTLAEALEDLSVKLDDRGLSILPSTMVSDNIEQRIDSGDTRLSILKAKWKSYGLNYKEQLRVFINKNHSLYPGFENSDKYIAGFVPYVENPDQGSIMM